MKRTEQREHIFKLMYEMEFHTPEEMKEQVESYFELRDLTENTAADYIRKKADAAAERIEEIDALINEKATGWKTARMNKVDLAILRLAVYEMEWDIDIPVSVAINEAVELARRFGGEESPAFVNGVLAKIVK